MAVTRRAAMAMVAMVAMVALRAAAMTTPPPEEEETPMPVGLNEGPLIEVRALVGGRALIPCDVTQPGDSPILILFYNGATGRPIFSIDARDVPLNEAQHWSGVGGRAKYSDHGLFLYPVSLQDDGDYRCRVDFRESPTRNVRVILLVVVPPTGMSILSQAKVEVSGVIGPYPVGGTLVLTCQARGGRPPPSVTWWHGGALLDEVSEQVTPSMTSNTLTLPNLSRQHLHRIITCQAQNSNLTAPLLSAVTLDMTFPPLEVRIVGETTPMVEGRAYQLVCEAGGSRPPATLSWWIGGAPIPNDKGQAQQGSGDGGLTSSSSSASISASVTQLVPGRHVVRHQLAQESGGNVSRSVLQLVARRDQNGAILMCRAKNPLLPKVALEDSLALDVQYPPRLKLHAGKNLVMSDIKEGDDVYFECDIEANPKVDRVRWFHEGVEVHHSVTAGIIQSNQSIALQGVTRSSSGHYSCSAANRHGSSSSSKLMLKVKFRPVCAPDQQWTYGGGSDRAVHVRCRVNAHPEAHTYRWAFNTSTETVYIPRNRTRKQGKNTSVMSYTPASQQDYGTLLCWAHNQVGTQESPCVYLVTPAAPPAPVHNCSVWHNASGAGEVVVACQPGWDGGLPQTFTLEVRKTSSSPSSSSGSRASPPSASLGLSLASLTEQDEPHFTVTGLSPGTEYILSVVSSNSQGAAPPTHLLHYTPIDVAEKRLSAHVGETFAAAPGAAAGGGQEEDGGVATSTILGMVGGAVGTLLACFAVVAAGLRRHHRHGAPPPHQAAPPPATATATAAVYSSGGRSVSTVFSADAGGGQGGQGGKVYTPTPAQREHADEGGFEQLRPDLIMVKEESSEGAGGRQGVASPPSRPVSFAPVRSSFAVDESEARLDGVRSPPSPRRPVSLPGPPPPPLHPDSSTLASPPASASIASSLERRLEDYSYRTSPSNVTLGDVGMPSALQKRGSGEGNGGGGVIGGGGGGGGRGGAALGTVSPPPAPSSILKRSGSALPFSSSLHHGEGLPYGGGGVGGVGGEGVGGGLQTALPKAPFSPSTVSLKRGSSFSSPASSSSSILQGGALTVRTSPAAKQRDLTENLNMSRESCV